MSIKEGDTFEVGTGGFKRQKTGEGSSFGGGDNGWGTSGDQDFSSNTNDTKMFQEYIILEREGSIDNVTVHYADIASLQMIGVISMDNYMHLSMIPPSLLTDASYVIKVFKTILSHKSK